MKRTAHLILLLAWFGTPLFAGPLPTFSLSLSSAEICALQHSPKLKSAELELESAGIFADVQRTLLRPRISLDGSFKYLTEVPSLKLPVAGSQEKKLGDNTNYSFGPTLTWTLFDDGALKKGWGSAVALKKSKEQEVEALKRLMILETRRSYFALQLAMEQVRLLGDSLKLAQAQHEDITLNVRAGAKSRIDALQAHQEVLLRKGQLREAQSELSSAVRDLFALTGLGDGIDVSTVSLELDPAERSLASLKNAATLAPGLSNPSLQALLRLAESTRLASESTNSNRWPKLIVSARTSADYPNGPDLSTINQNTFGASISLPLFESGKTELQAKEQVRRSLAMEKNRLQAEDDLLRDWGKAKDRLESLGAQQEINREAVKESEELSALVYSSYKAGRSTYIEVQSANLRTLKAKVQSARTDMQILIQLAALAALGD
jgi:outer membrane protein TolC